MSALCITTLATPCGCAEECLLIPCCDCSFSLRSLRPLSKGDELTISYGAEKPNKESLRDYGFVLPGNSHDRIQFGSKEDKTGSGDGRAAGKNTVNSLYGLNEACLMEVRGCGCFNPTTQ